MVVGRVFPARAGMGRCSIRRGCRYEGVPRACGDGPTWVFQVPPHRTCSPRVRGWAELIGISERPFLVFPARAGMDRASS